MIERAQAGDRLDEPEIVRLFAARDADDRRVLDAADELRRAVSGDVIRYVVNRNINYAHICSYRCRFCAFSKGKTHEALRGAPYDLAMAEIVRRAIEAWERGATEVCLQGGIHPDYTGETYLSICRAIKAAVPDMHIHAFSPLEVTQGAKTLGTTVRSFLAELKAAGLSTLPGTAAEILDDEVRAVICADKVSTAEWLDVGVGRPAQKADFVVLLNGGYNTRPFVAAALVHGGFVPKILLNTVYDNPDQSSRAVPHTYEFSLKVIEYGDVARDRVVVLDSAARTTFDEAKGVADYLASHPAKRLMIVTDGPHTRRARWIFQSMAR